MPLSDTLIHELKAAKEAVKATAERNCPLLFHTTGCLLKFDALHVLKTVAKRAGLNPDEFRLHRFRTTFTTAAIQAGVDLRTVQQWLGHTDFESTLRYLKPLRMRQCGIR